MIALSVLLCTHNPHSRRLQLVLSGLSTQSLDQSLWELVVIDNASSPPISFDLLDAAQQPRTRLLREPELGLTPARLTAISAAQADVIVFVDDDNVLAPDYLQQALDLMHRDPRVGAAGGILYGFFEVPPPPWCLGYLDLLGIRNFGNRPIQALIYNQVGPWEPIGAGMVIRTIIARYYAQLACDPIRRQLDRRGGALGSCGDTDMARCAPDLGYFMAYEPSLKLKHLIPAFRLRYSYMLRLVRALKRSGILLDRLRTGRPDRLPSSWQRWLQLVVRGLRLATPRFRLWILRISALSGEIEARAIHIPSKPSVLKV